MTKNIEPLRDGRMSIRDQAVAASVAVPVGLTVKELQERGFDVDPEWPLHAVLIEDSDSPTGLVVIWLKPFSDQAVVYALAT